jgi:hypothetical protein
MPLPPLAHQEPLPTRTSSRRHDTCMLCMIWFALVLVLVSDLFPVCVEDYACMQDDGVMCWLFPLGDMLGRRMGRQ